MSVLPAFSLHLITSRTRLAPDAPTVAQQLLALEAQLDEAIDAGIDVIQIRERDLEAGLAAKFASRIVTRTAPTRTIVLVSERADVAIAAGAHGVHLPSFGLPADQVRRLRPGWTVGRSLHAGDQPADWASCDYLLFGTVFPSESKSDHAVTSGQEGLARAVGRFARPIVAIGGITPERVAACADAGASGVAAIGAFLPPGRARDARGARAAVAAFRASIAARTG